MKTQEFEFKGFVGNGFAFLFLNLILTDWFLPFLYGQESSSWNPMKPV